MIVLIIEKNVTIEFTTMYSKPLHVVGIMVFYINDFSGIG